MKYPSGNDKNVQVSFVKLFKTNLGVENEKALVLEHMSVLLEYYPHFIGPTTGQHTHSDQT